ILSASGNSLELKQENHSEISSARSHHNEAIKSGYSSGFFKINGGWHVLGIAVSVLLAAPALLSPGCTDNYPEWHFTTPAGWFTLLMVLAMLVANGVFGML